MSHHHHNRQRPQRQQYNINQGFGGFNAFSDFERMFDMDDFNDPFDDMFMRNPFQQFHNFLSDGHHGMGGMGDGPMFNMEHQGQRFGPDNCTMITKSYVTRMDYSDGTPHQETYKSQSIRHTGQDGKKISEKQETYKNSRTGVERAGFQRMLNDKGQKCIKERNTKTGQQDAHVLYKGMQEEDLNNFNQEYGQYRQQVNFQKNYDMLASMKNNHKRLGDGRGGNRRGQQHAQAPPLGLPSGYEDEQDVSNTPQQEQFQEQMKPQQQHHSSQKKNPYKNKKNMNNPKDYYGGYHHKKQG